MEWARRCRHSRRVLRGTGSPGRGARANGSRVDVRWERPEAGAGRIAEGYAQGLAALLPGRYKL